MLFPCSVGNKTVKGQKRGRFSTFLVSAEVNRGNECCLVDWWWNKLAKLVRAALNVYAFDAKTLLGYAEAYEVQNSLGDHPIRVSNSGPSVGKCTNIVLLKRTFQAKPCMSHLHWGVFNIVKDCFRMVMTLWVMMSSVINEPSSRIKGAHNSLISVILLIKEKK